MRATRSDAMTLDECLVSDDALIVRADDIIPFRRRGANWFWGSYTAVYLGIAVAAYKAIVANVRERTPPGYSQSLAYHPTCAARGGDERRSRGGAAPDLSRGVAERHRRPDARRRRGALTARSISSARR